MSGSAAPDFAGDEPARGERIVRQAGIRRREIGTDVAAGEQRRGERERANATGAPPRAAISARPRAGIAAFFGDTRKHSGTIRNDATAQ